MAGRQTRSKQPEAADAWALAADLARGILPIKEALLKPGDEAIVFDPVDFLFKYSVEQVGAKAISFPTPQSDGPIDFSVLNTLITPKTKLICYSKDIGDLFSRYPSMSFKEYVYLSGVSREKAGADLEQMCRSGKLTTWETERATLYLSTVKLEQGFV